MSQPIGVQNDVDVTRYVDGTDFLAKLVTYIQKHELAASIWNMRWERYVDLERKKSIRRKYANRPH